MNIREYNHQYYLQNKEEISARTRAWKKENKERVLELNAGYRERHREKLLKKQRDYRRTKRSRVLHLKTRYGLTEEGFNKLLEMQHGRCLICRRMFSDLLKPHVDHCHKTSMVRGILCFTCNTAIGKLRNIQTARRALKYMESLELFEGIGPNA